MLTEDDQKVLIAWLETMSVEDLEKIYLILTENNYHSINEQ